MPIKNEGVRRLQFVAAIVAFGGAGLMFLWLVIASLATRNVTIAGQFPAILIPLMFGGGLWLLGWIVEGFLRTRDNPSVSGDD